MQPVLRMHMHCVPHARETQASNAFKAYDADESIARFQTLACGLILASVYT